MCNGISLLILYIMLFVKYRVQWYQVYSLLGCDAMKLDMYLHFKVTYCLICIPYSTTEASVYQTTWHHHFEDGNLNTQHSEREDIGLYPNLCLQLVL